MARTTADKGPEVITLVSPDGEIKREAEVGSELETKLRWDGYLPPEQQKLEAPVIEVDGPKTVGTYA